MQKLILNDKKKCNIKNNNIIFKNINNHQYITNINGYKYKIPNTKQSYKFLETKVNNIKVILNVTVDKLINSEKNKLSKIAKYIGIKNCNIDGYYFTEILISYGNKYIIFNKNIEIKDTNITKKSKEFNIEYDNTFKKFECEIRGNSIYKSIYINIYNFKIELQKILNPQILNCINIPKNNYKIKGIFNTTKNPEKFIIKNINAKKIFKKKLYNKITNNNLVSVC